MLSILCYGSRKKIRQLQKCGIPKFQSLFYQSVSLQSNEHPIPFLKKKKLYRTTKRKQLTCPRLFSPQVPRNVSNSLINMQAVAPNGSFDLEANHTSGPQSVVYISNPLSLVYFYTIIVINYSHQFSFSIT